MATRPLEFDEYIKIINLLNEGGFQYVSKETKKERTFKGNFKIAMILQLQATLGLRVGDVLALKVNSFKNGKLETREDKTGKLQYRDIDPSVYNAILEYALEHGLAKEDKLFSYSVRQVQKVLEVVCMYLGLTNISTHSFRKLFATTVYEQHGHNLELVKELLNHTSIATTQRYIRVSQQQINKASSSVNFMISCK